MLQWDLYRPSEAYRAYIGRHVRKWGSRQKFDFYCMWIYLHLLKVGLWSSSKRDLASRQPYSYRLPIVCYNLINHVANRSFAVQLTLINSSMLLTALPYFDFDFQLWVVSCSRKEGEISRGERERERRIGHLSEVRPKELARHRLTSNYRIWESRIQNNVDELKRAVSIIWYFQAILQSIHLDCSDVLNNRPSVWIHSFNNTSYYIATYLSNYVPAANEWGLSPRLDRASYEVDHHE